MKDSNGEDKFQGAVNYLTGSSGVNGAVIADREGLLIACSPTVMPEGELYAALGLQITTVIDNDISRLIDPGCGYVSIKTDKKWLIVGAILNVYLVVLADRKVDDLLNVRIQRALEMITGHIKDKYPAEVYSTEPVALEKGNTMEATHV